MFISSIGTTLLLISVSVTYLLDTGSILSATTVYVAQFLPPLFFASAVAKLCHRTESRPILVSVELLSLGVALGIGLLFNHSYILVFVLLLIRGCLDMTLKAARGVALKRYVPSEHLARGNSLLNAGYYLGAGAGSLAGVAMIGHLTILQIAMVDAATYLLAALCYAALRPRRRAHALEPTPTGAWRQVVRAMSADPRLARAFAYLLLSVMLLQGMNQLLRVWLPLEWLGLPAGGAAVAETVGLVGILTGLGIVARWMSSKIAASTVYPSVLLLAAALMASPLIGQHPLPVFAAYCGFTAAFEILYTKSFNDMLLLVRPVDAPALMAVFYSTAFASMTITTLVASRFADSYGMPIVVLTASCLTVLFVVLVELAFGSARGYMATTWARHLPHRHPRSSVSRMND
ncbi:MFS transporter [Plantactinospora sp. WMMC1484]|uniref:MFS transporter n=1 Tax=Plantactinospora sp. WMMC1484 TaxID=3404122 RepID=UPI003BF5566A